MDAIALLGLDDAAVEVNVTPDRGYAFSIRGIAREYSHSTGAAFRDPADAVQVVEATGYDVTIDDRAPIRGRAGCSVFTARIVRGIDPTRPTPPWMASRLRLAGIRSISLLVDITNYTMLELGQPIHGYDLAKLQGGMVIRRATHGRDPRDPRRHGAHARRHRSGRHRRLRADRPRRCDGWRDHRDVVDHHRRADRGRDLGSGDDRAHRPPAQAAERGRQALRARRRPRMSAVAQRASPSCSSTSPAAPSTRSVRVYDESVPPAADRPGAADCRPRWSGVEYTPEQITSTLELIGATVVAVAGQGAAVTVTPPTWRPDLTDPPTLVEEIARIIGYHEIPSILPVAPPGRGLTRAQQARRRAAQTLAAAGRDRGALLSVRVGGDRRAVRARRHRDPPRERARSAGRRCSAARCCPVCSRPPAATCRAGSPISRSSRSGPCSVPSPASCPVPTSSRSEPSAPTTRRSRSSPPASRRRAGASAPCSSATRSPKQPGAAAVPAA